MKNLALLFLATVLTFCTQQTPQEEQPTANEAFAEMLENYAEDGLKLFPINATFQGDNRYNDLLRNDLTANFNNELKTHYTGYLKKLESFDRSSLSSEEQISHDILKWECEIALAEMQYHAGLMPVDQFWTTQLMIGQLASGSSAQPFETKEDYDNWLKRVDVFVEWCDTAIMRMKEGIAQDIVLPKSLSAKVIPQLAAWKDGPAETHHFYLPAKNIPEEISMVDVEDIKATYAVLVEKKVIPAINRLHDFFKNEYLPAGRETSGIGALPKGDEWYQHRIKLYTTTDMTADEVFELGKSEVARIRDEMEKVMAQVGFEGTLNEFFDHVRMNPDLMPFTNPQQVIHNFNAIHERMKPNLNELFDLTPKTPFEVRRTEAFREASASAEYNPGSIDGTRPGIFYVPIPNVSRYNMYSDESLFLHEAIPGHHYQISLAQENEQLPSFRRSLWYSSYGEGWALYSESLGKELGLYTDPYQYFGMLSAEMHRAIRLVVDAGLHAKGWTREEAIQYSLENEAESEASITSEIERYMAGPGQALSYKVGQLKILELRKQAKDALGDKFDIREYHNIVLESGCVPLTVLERKIENWMASKLESINRD
ncbi:DUF885 domain-containing protein [Ekhidna sp. To15]|uniref:DUF885 domain-containing protein n=1 Tax=Ekhidna sp. To15 TaxID=3395267 RepID=UPI003F5231DA